MKPTTYEKAVKIARENQPVAEFAAEAPEEADADFTVSWAAAKARKTLDERHVVARITIEVQPGSPRAAGGLRLHVFEVSR